MRLAVYTRQSKTDADSVPSTVWQAEECRRWAAERDHQIVLCLDDIDRSGYRRVARPGFKKLLDSLRSGEIGGVVVWRLDRLSRQGQWGPDVLAFMSARQPADAALFSVSEDIDTSTASGELVLGVRMSIAKAESEAISARWRRQKAAAAAAGLPRSGGPRWFGWTAAFEVNEAEAAAIRCAYEHVLAGGSLRSLVLGWNDQGLTTSTDRPWTSQTLRQLLRSPRMAGVRVHRGVEVGQGTWPGIVSRDLVERARVLLDAPGRCWPRSGVRLLLSGVLRCGECGGRVRGVGAVNGRRRYGCPPKPDGCGSVTVVAAEVELFVTDAVLARIDSPSVRAALADRLDVSSQAAGLVSEIALVETRRDEALGMFAAGELDRAQLADLNRKLTDRLAQLHRALRDMQQPSVLEEIGSGEVEAGWEQLDVDRQRALIAALVDEIVVHDPSDDYTVERRWLTLAQRAAAARANGDTRTARRLEAKVGVVRGGGGCFHPERVEIRWSPLTEGETEAATKPSR